MAIQKNTILYGQPLESIVGVISESDIVQSMTDGIPELLNDLECDSINVLLTVARICYTIKKKRFTSKDRAAGWARDHLPKEHHATIELAIHAYNGIEDPEFPDFVQKAKSCIDCLLKQFNIAS
jgi:streptomycin 3"-adenylyltransferase